MRGEKRHDTALQSRTGTGRVRGKVPSDAPAQQVGTLGKFGKTKSTPPHALNQQRKTFRDAAWARPVATTCKVIPTGPTQKQRWPGLLAALRRGHPSPPHPRHRFGQVWQAKKCEHPNYFWKPGPGLLLPSILRLFWGLSHLLTLFLFREELITGHLLYRKQNLPNGFIIRTCF